LVTATAIISRDEGTKAWGVGVTPHSFFWSERKKEKYTQGYSRKTEAQTGEKDILRKSGNRAGVSKISDRTADQQQRLFNQRDEVVVEKGGKRPED